MPRCACCQLKKRGSLEVLLWIGLERVLVNWCTERANLEQAILDDLRVESNPVLDVGHGITPRSGADAKSRTSPARTAAMKEASIS